MYIGLPWPPGCPAGPAGPAGLAARLEVSEKLYD